jgi:hypothetical protein
MSLYLVAYDHLNHETFGEYEYFMSELRRYKAQRVLLFAWILRSALDSEAVRNSLLKFVHSGDRLLVAEISPTNWAGWKALAEIQQT